MPTPAPPPLDESLIARLRADLAAARYESERVEELLGPIASAALRREQTIPARRAVAASSDPAAVLLGLFTLGIHASRPTVDRVLPTLGADGALALGLLVEAADPDGTEDTEPSMLAATVDLHPYSATDDAGEVRWWIASDRSEAATGAPLDGEHVLGVGGASLTLASITPRTQVERVLDMGCGCGIQAMHASRHAGTVVATDLSERALGFAAFNAALNGIELDLRAGSLFDPVADERFDLVVSNPPFVITPRDGRVQTWTYRDGGAAGDTLLAQILRALPAHLAPGGRAVMLGNWEITGDAWDRGPRAWLDGSDLDAWIVQREIEDVAEYAHTWARDGGVSEADPRYRTMVDAWLDDFASRAVDAVGFGYLVLQRPADGTRSPIRRFEEARGRGSGSLGAHLGSSLDALTALAEIDDEALLDAHLIRADDCVERRHLTPGAWDPMLIELVQGGGFARTLPMGSTLAATVGACDGDLTARQIIAAVCALTDADAEAECSRLAPLLREMIAGGLLLLRR